MSAKTSRHKEVERKFDVVEATVSPSFDGLSAVARVERLPTQTARRRVLRHPRPRPGAQPDHLAAAHRRARRGLAPEAARRRRRAHRGPHRRSPIPTRCPTSCATSCWRSCATGRWRRWHASRPSATSRCSTAPTARRWPSSATTRSPPRRVPTTSSSGGNGNSNSPRAATTPDLLTRLGNRLLDAGAAPAGHGSKLARVLAAGRGRPPTTHPPPSRPIRFTGPWPSRSTSWSAGTAPCAPTAMTRCTRCG